LTQQEVKELLPELKWRVVDLGAPEDTSISQQPDPLTEIARSLQPDPPLVSKRPPLHSKPVLLSWR
jgi:hypothetical protein